MLPKTAATSILDQNQRQTREVSASGVWRKWKLDKFAEISFFFTPSPDATQHHASIKFASQQPWRNLRMHYTSKSKPTSSAVILLFPTLSLQAKKALASRFGGKPGAGLNALRYQRCFEKLATKTSHIVPQNLPPKAAAARVHSLRV